MEKHASLFRLWMNVKSLRKCFYTERFGTPYAQFDVMCTFARKDNVILVNVKLQSLNLGQMWQTGPFGQGRAVGAMLDSQLLVRLKVSVDKSLHPLTDACQSRNVDVIHLRKDDVHPHFLWNCFHIFFFPKVHPSTLYQTFYSLVVSRKTM